MTHQIGAFADLISWLQIQVRIFSHKLQICILERHLSGSIIFLFYQEEIAQCLISMPFSPARRIYLEARIPCAIERRTNFETNVSNGFFPLEGSSKIVQRVGGKAPEFAFSLPPL